MLGPTFPGCIVLDSGAAAFLYQGGGALEVSLMANFNGWGKTPMPMKRLPPHGDFVLTTGPLPPGLHTYKYLVDGRWVTDPQNLLSRDDGVGGRNSAFVVRRGPRTPSVKLRALTLNLHTHQEARPLAKLEDVALLCAVAEVDLLLLQEVGEHVSDPRLPNAGGVLQRLLSAFTGQTWHHEFREAHIGFDVFREGLSLLSNRPLDEVSTLRLSEGPLARIALAATVQIDGISLRAVTVHTSYDASARAEVRELLRGLSDAPPTDAVLVSGDLNGGPSSAHVRALTKAGFLDVGHTLSDEGPTFFGGERIDYHLLRQTPGASPIAPRRISRLFDGGEGFSPRVSDHMGVLLELG